MKGSLAQSLPRQQGLPLNSFPPNFSVELFFGVRSVSPKIAFLFVTFSLAKQRKSKIMRAKVEKRDYNKCMKITYLQYKSLAETPVTIQSIISGVYPRLHKGVEMDD